MSRTQLFADGISELEITATPVNGLGFPAPFRNSNTTFVIEEGKKLVEITMLNEKSGKLRLRAKFTPGKVIVLVKPKYALFPTRVEILVEMNVA
ncbi:MAG: hypothetical protein LWX56_13370 [Ignavibacteria bacterium]|nr:hypothetical protein [Ignavibacteria bacterium]